MTTRRSPPTPKRTRRRSRKEIQTRRKTADRRAPRSMARRSRRRRSGRARGSATLMPEDSMEGGCTCRQVRYRLTGRPLIVHACHCRWCQRETGTVHALNALYEADRVVHTAGEPEIINTPSASGRGQNIARCPACGRRLEQLPAGWTFRPLRAGRHAGSARSMPTRHPHLHVVEADLGDAPDRRKGRAGILRPRRRLAGRESGAAPYHAGARAPEALMRDDQVAGRGKRGIFFRTAQKRKRRLQRLVILRVGGNV